MRSRNYPRYFIDLIPQNHQRMFIYSAIRPLKWTYRLVIQSMKCLLVIWPAKNSDENLYDFISSDRFRRILSIAKMFRVINNDRFVYTTTRFSFSFHLDDIGFWFSADADQIDANAILILDNKSLQRYLV